MNYLQQILEALKAKFQGVSESVLNRIAKSLAKTVTTEDQVKTVVDGVTLQKVIDAYGDSRATEAQQTAVHNYEQQYGLKDGKPVNGGGSAAATGAQAQPGAAATATQTITGGAAAGTQPTGIEGQHDQLLEQNKKLNERLDGFEAARATNVRKQQLSEVYNKLPEALRKPYEHIAVDSLKDEDFQSLLGQGKTEVDGLVTTRGAKGAVFGKPTTSGGGGGTGDELTEAELKEINARPGIPGKDQQPF